MFKHMNNIGKKQLFLIINTNILKQELFNI